MCEGGVSAWRGRSVQGVFAPRAAQAMFNAAQAFNADISKWDVSNVGDMLVRLLAAADPPPHSRAPTWGCR